MQGVNKKEKKQLTVTQINKQTRKQNKNQINTSK